MMITGVSAANADDGTADQPSASAQTDAPAPEETDAPAPEETDAPAPEETDAPAPEQTQQTDAPAADEPQQTDAPVQSHSEPAFVPYEELVCWKLDSPDWSTPQAWGFPQSLVDCGSIPGFDDEASYVESAGSCEGAKWQWDWYSIKSKKDEKHLAYLKTNGLTLDSSGYGLDTVFGLYPYPTTRSPQSGHIVSVPDESLCTPVIEPIDRYEDVCDLATAGLPFSGQSGRVFYVSNDNGATWTISGFDLRNVSGCEGESLVVKEASEQFSACDLSTIAGLPTDIVAAHAGQSGTVTKSWKQSYFVEGQTESPRGEPFDVSYTFAGADLNCGTPGAVDAQCVGDVPWLQYSVKAGSDIPAGSRLRITFVHPTDASQNYTIDGLSVVSGKFLWPGATVDANGVASGWPGWALDSNGEWISVGDANYGWTRNGVQVKFETYVPAGRTVARTVSATALPRSFVSTVSYPEATALCAGPAERVLGETVSTGTPERVLPLAVNSGENETATGSNTVGLLLAGGGAALILGSVITMAGARYRGKHTS